MHWLRVRNMLSTVLLVIGALAVGDALNGSVVTGTYALTSQAALVRIFVGLALIVLGYKAQLDLDEAETLAPARSIPDDEEPAQDAFDPELSPVGENFERQQTIDNAESESDHQGSPEAANHE